MGNDAEVRLKVTLDDKDTEKKITSLENKTKKLGEQFSKAGKLLTVGLTLPIVGFGALALKEAMEFESTGAKFGTVFGDMADDVDDFLMEFKKLSPVTKAEGRVLIAGVQDMLVPLGFVREEATQMSKEFMHLAGALSSFGDKSVTVEQTMGAMQSALAGSMEPLRSLGIVTNAVEIEQRALAISGKKTTKELTQQDKASAILAIAYANSTDALEAYTEANLDADTKLKIATADFRDQAMVLGTHLLPILQQGVELLTKLTSWFASLSEEEQTTLLIVLGLVAALGPLLSLLGSIMTAMPIIIALFKGIGVAMLFVSSPIGLIIAGILVLVAFILYLIKNWEAFSTGVIFLLTKLGDFIVGIWKWIGDIIVGALTWVGDFIVGFIQGVINKWRGLGDFMISVFKNVGKILGAVFKGIGNVFIGLINLITSGINALLRGVLAPFNAIISGLNLIPGVNIPALRIAIPKIPKLETGTNNIPREGLYHLHPGEAVVPKKYNPNNGRNQVIYIQQPALEIDGKRFANATAPYMARTFTTGGAMA